MSNKTNIEEGINILERYLKRQDRTIVPEHRFKFLKAIENILADRERLEKENEELMEVKISALAHNRIEELTRENLKLKTELEDKRKEYQDTYKDVREELKELQAKANKYDNLVEKIKEEKEQTINEGKADREKHTEDVMFRQGYYMALEELLDTKEV